MIMTQFDPKAMSRQVLPLEDSNLSPETILNTFVEHVAIQIAAKIPVGATVLITGGGTYNSYLIKRIKEHLKAILSIPSSAIVEYKEALIFGLLGVLRLRNSINCLSSVTGAERDHSSGAVFNP